MLTGFRRELDETDLTSVAVFMVGASQALNIVAVGTVFFRNDKLVTGATLWSILPVVVWETINFSDFSLSKRLLSDLLFTRCTGETSEMVGSLKCSDYVVRDWLPTGPAKLQTGLVTVFTEGDSRLVVIMLPCQWTVTGSTLEAAIVVRPVQSLYRWLRKSNRFPTKATHLFTLAALVLANFRDLLRMLILF